MKNVLDMKTVIGQGEVAFHVTGFGSSTYDAFLEWFGDNIKAVDYALSPAMDGVWSRLPSDDVKKAKELLSGFGDPSDNNSKPLPTKRPPAFPAKAASSDVVGQGNLEITPQEVVTNVGKFKSLDRLMNNLNKMFDTIGAGEMLSIFGSCRKDLNIGYVDYLNEPLFSKFIRLAKSKCDDKVIESLGGIADTEEYERLEHIKDFPYQVVNVNDDEDVTYYKTWPKARTDQVLSNKNNNGEKYKASKRSQV